MSNRGVKIEEMSELKQHEELQEVKQQN